MNTRYIDQNEANKVRDFFLTFDNDFYPPLSQRNGDLENIYIGRALREGRVGIVEKDCNGNGGREIIAATTYWYEGNVLRMCVTGVAKLYRRSPALARLLSFVIEQESERGLQKIFAKTWSTNDSMKGILQKVGFKRTAVIEGDMANNRITETFELDFEDAKNYLLKRL